MEHALLPHRRFFALFLPWLESGLLALARETTRRTPLVRECTFGSRSPTLRPYVILRHPTSCQLMGAPRDATLPPRIPNTARGPNIPHALRPAPRLRLRGPRAGGHLRPQLHAEGGGARHPCAPRRETCAAPGRQAASTRCCSQSQTRRAADPTTRAGRPSAASRGRLRVQPDRGAAAAAPTPRPATEPQP